ncbi:metal-dependent transcriptional regulator [Chitinispirillales bacterium ANBcel5]|uniref:metal-dependent transcriptional regulator n=1 Tax=Cellulosispirillum alkaliphilum TaxID=3039283 RepID=UPI002A594BE6|nr:metal-dependent transcriptional regulator [Chitinispirillales bacterium ANBcel5]
MSEHELTSTLEDYLETILNIVSTRKVARSMEIAESLNVKRPTVTVALRTLAEKGLINYEPRSYITLTDNGEKIAKCVDKRHHVLRDFFMEVLNLSLQESETAACHMEHSMDNNLCEAVTNLLTALRNDQDLASRLKKAMKTAGKTGKCKKVCKGTALGNKE